MYKMKKSWHILIVKGIVMDGGELMIKTLWQMFKVFLLFTGCTILFYYSIVWINREYENYHRYDEPQGSAVKVSTIEKPQSEWLDRLLFFYRDGE
jgi:hypothetical protein